MTRLKQGDKLLLHSKDGHNYKIVIENINYYRPSGMIYAVNMINDCGISYFDIYGDYLFCGEDFISLCEREGDEK